MNNSSKPRVTVRIWCKRFCAGVWCEGLELQPGKCRSCEIMMRKSHWSRERGWIKIWIMEDGWPTTLHHNIMWWIDHHLKPGYIWKEIWNKDAGLSLAYFCTNRQLVFISQYFYMSLFFFLKKAYIILLVYIFIRHGINRKIDKPDYFSLSYWKLQRSLTWPN